MPIRGRTDERYGYKNYRVVVMPFFPTALRLMVNKSRPFYRFNLSPVYPNRENCVIGQPKTNECEKMPRGKQTIRSWMRMALTQQTVLALNTAMRKDEIRLVR